MTNRKILVILILFLYGCGKSDIPEICTNCLFRYKDKWGNNSFIAIKPYYSDSIHVGSDFVIEPFLNEEGNLLFMISVGNSGKYVEFENSYVEFVATKPAGSFRLYPDSIIRSGHGTYATFLMNNPTLRELLVCTETPTVDELRFYANSNAEYHSTYNLSYFNCLFLCLQNKSLKRWIKTKPKSFY